MNTSLFDTLEAFSLQEEMALDESFGLAQDVLPADLDTYLDLQLGLDDGLKPEVHSQKSLEDLFFPDTTGDAFGDEWMETVNISSFLDNQSNGNSEAPPKATVELKATSKPEIKLEGLKPSAYELLKALLTTDTLAKPVTEVPTVDQVLPSPEAEVPSVSIVTPDIESFLSAGSPTENLSLVTDLNCYEIQPVVSLDNGDVAEIVIDPLMDLFGGELQTRSPVGDEMEVILSSPSSPEDVSTITLHSVSDSGFTDSESSFSSSPSSPNFLLTINSSHLHTDSSKCSDKGSQISDTEFTPVKPRAKGSSSRKESRSTPYVKPVEVEKKDRKRVQNKNAATRYREKKRSEKDTMFDQEHKLLDKNKELREKVDSLHREISYMKELMQEIQKAKLSKI